MCNEEDRLPLVFERAYDRILKKGFSNVCINYSFLSKGRSNDEI